MHDVATVVDRAQELMPHARQFELIEYLEGGWSNRNYRMLIDGIETVVRLKSAHSVAPTHESRYLKISLAPRVLAYDEASGDMITAYIEGDLLVNSPIDAKTAAAYMLELHSEIPVGVRSYQVEPLLARYLEGLQLEESLQEVYQDLHWEPQRICGCHNELNDWNVIKTKDGFCTLDWESAGDNDPIFDLVGLCYGLEFEDEEFDECIYTYDSQANQHHVQRTRVLYQIREHAWALDRLRHGSNHKGIVKQRIDTAAEILRLSNT